MKTSLLLVVLIGINFGLSAQVTDTGDKVGIGTTSPADKLTVNGNTRVIDPTNQNRFLLLHGNGHGNKIRSYGGNLLLETRLDSEDIEFKTNNSVTPLMIIKGDGNIGIGTTNPSEELELVGDLKVGRADNNAYMRISGGGNIGHINWYKTNGERAAYMGWGNNSIDDFNLQLENNTKFLINGGKVGIGTTSPLTQFHIKDLNITPILNITGKAPNTGNDQLISEIRLSNLYDNLTGHRASIKAISDKSGSHGNVAFQFNTSIWNGQHTEIEAMRISSNGNMGIGTTNPDMKLTVKGKIHAEEVKIDLSIPAPDYVFEKDYDLKTLTELEKFITENNHLPGIPSAKEFEQHGIMQAEMDMNLLKKIEELSLYTIQQQKEIEILKKENEEVKLLNIKLLELQSRLEKLESEK